MKKDYVVITGASSGIGQALTIHLAKFGFDIIAIGRNEIALQRTKLLSSPGKITLVVADITKESELDKIAQVFNTEDTVKYLVHCAATSAPYQALLKVSRPALENAYAVNALAPIFLTQKLAHFFNSETRVLFIGSDYVGVDNKIRPHVSGPYGATKSALRVNTEYLRKESDLALIGYLNPGSTDTPMFHDLMSAVLTQNSMFKAVQPAHPDKVAKFMQSVLMYSSNQDFMKINWDYRINEHHELAQNHPQLRSKI